MIRKRFKSLSNRSIEIIRSRGLRGYLHAVKEHVSLYPVGEELWYMLNYLLRPSHKTIKTIQESKMLLDLSDVGIHKDLFLHGCREPECTRILQGELSEGIKVVDIGANIGYYALMEAQIIGNTGKVYAIEPEPKNLEILKRNVELNSYTDRIELYNLAIGDTTKETLLEISDASNLHKIASKNFSTITNQNYIRIKMTTLDEFLKDKHADFIRMDVEGFEHHILKGMKQNIKKGEPLKMFIEVHTKLIEEYGGSIEEMLELLSEANFDVTFLVMKFIPSFSVSKCIAGGPFPSEKAIEYRQPLKKLITNEKVRELLLHRPYYSLFLERRSSKQ